MPPTRQDAILPSLFDRLTDQGGSTQFGGLFMSAAEYMETVRRDLSWLLKTDTPRPDDVVLMDSGEEMAGKHEDDISPASLADFPGARTSILTYGIPLSRGVAINNGGDGLELKRSLEHAIRVFEPRVERLSVRIIPQDQTGSEKDETSVCVIRVMISGHVRIKSERLDLMFQAYYTPAFAQWRIEGGSHGS